jgi:hypothetical protein
VPPTFRALDVGPAVDPRLAESFAAAWPSYRAWFLREGEAARPSYAESRAALAWHMPELLGTFDDLCAGVGGGDLEARFLSHWCPPPVATACSLATWTRDADLLVRYVLDVALAALVSDPWATAYDLVGGFLRAPVQRDPLVHEWGTEWTSVYDCDAGTLDLLWPGESWRLSLWDTTGVRVRRTPPTLVAA